MSREALTATEAQLQQHIAQRADFQRLVQEEVERRMLVNTPRLLTTHSEVEEREFAQLVMAALVMMQDHGDNTEIAIPGLTLGILRNHVKWCQTVGANVEQSRVQQEHIQRLQSDYLQLRRRAERLVDENNGLKDEIMQVKKNAKTRT